MKSILLRNANLNKFGGFTLVELVIGLGIFALVASAFLSAYLVLARSVQTAREKTIIASMSTQYLEVVRNLPYSQVGTLNGNPTGGLPDSTSPNNVNIEGQAYRIFYEVTYVDDPADGTVLGGTDTSPDDYKQVKLTIQKVLGGTFAFLTNISPQGLEGSAGTGTILVKVINASGQPVPDATITIQNTYASPAINLNRTSDGSGEWVEVGLPQANGAVGSLPANSYHLVVTKTGYSTDQTYPITISNPNPIKPDATVVSGQVTQLTFVIDAQSNLTIRTLDSFCQAINGVNVNVKGSKLIGVNPDVLKFNNNYTSAGGAINLNNIEWDTYTPSLISGQSWLVYGTNPIQQIDILPGVNQVFTLILGPVTTNTLLVIVKDASTGTALENALVHLRKGGSVPQDYYGSTGGSVWVQYSWVGGSGQVNWASTTNTRYFADDGNVNINSNPTGIQLKKTSGRYATSGWLESSTFDTGSSSNFSTLEWEPTSQNPATTLKLQIATNNDNATWNYKGPDGTAGTYYTVSGSAIASIHNGDRYVRYKVFESTTNDKYSPVMTSLHINYVSGCYTPGQTIFTSLTAGNNYDLTISLAGYQTQQILNMTITTNQTLEVLMSP